MSLEPGRAGFSVQKPLHRSYLYLSHRARGKAGRRFAFGMRKRCGARLTWGPVHGAAAEDMHVQVVDGLSAFGTGADDEAVSLAESLLAGDLGGFEHEVAEEGVILADGFGHRSEVFLRDDEDVGGRDRLNIVEGEHEVVFLHFFRRDAAGDELAEEAIHRKTVASCWLLVVSCPGFRRSRPSIRI